MAGLIDATKSNLQKFIGSIAPVLGTAIAGPAGGVVLSLLASAFGADKSNVEDILSKVQSDPDYLIKIKKIENEHAESLAKISNQNFALETADKQDARKYSTVYRSFLVHMAFVVTIGFFGVLFLLFTSVEISEEGRNLLSLLVGMLASKWQTIIDFFYGSSHSKKSNLHP